MLEPPRHVLRIRADGRPYDPLVHTMLRALPADEARTRCGRPVFSHDNKHMPFPTCFECIAEPVESDD